MSHKAPSAMGRNQFNEDSRVKVPVILQLVRLGYEFLPRAAWERQREPQTNILRDEFARAYMRLNEGKTEADAQRYIDTVLVPMLNNNDLGRQFYKKLVPQTTGERLIDFEYFNSNSFHVATEVDCTNEGEEFRPDVMVFVDRIDLADQASDELGARGLPSSTRKSEPKCHSLSSTIRIINYAR